MKSRDRWLGLGIGDRGSTAKGGKRQGVAAAPATAMAIYVFHSRVKERVRERERVK